LESQTQKSRRRETIRGEKVTSSKPEVRWPHAQPSDEEVAGMISMPLQKPSFDY